jgi:hypothetical protein
MRHHETTDLHSNSFRVYAGGSYVIGKENTFVSPSERAKHVKLTSHKAVSAQPADHVKALQQCCMLTEGQSGNSWTVQCMWFGFFSFTCKDCSEFILQLRHCSISKQWWPQREHVSRLFTSYFSRVDTSFINSLFSRSFPPRNRRYNCGHWGYFSALETVSDLGDEFSWCIRNLSRFFSQQDYTNVNLFSDQLFNSADVPFWPRMWRTKIAAIYDVTPNIFNYLLFI